MFGFYFEGDCIMVDLLLILFTTLMASSSEATTGGGPTGPNPHPLPPPGGDGT
jgi:hypothetical protein